MSEISINVVKLIYGVAFMGSKKCKGSHPCLISLSDERSKEVWNSFRERMRSPYLRGTIPIEEGYLIQNYSKDPLDLSDYQIERYNEDDSKILNYLDTCVISTKDLISFLFTHNQSLKLRNGEFQVFNPNFSDYYDDDLLLWNFYFVFNGLYTSYYINYLGKAGPRYTYKFTKEWKNIVDTEISYLPKFLNSNVNEIFKTMLAAVNYREVKLLTFLNFINKHDALTSNSDIAIICTKENLFNIPTGYYHVTSEQNLLLEKRMNGGESSITTKSAKSKERVSDDIVYFNNQVIANPNIIKLPHASGIVRLQLGKRFDTEKLKDFDFGETKLILDLNKDKSHPVDDNILKLKHIMRIRNAFFKNNEEVRCEELDNCFGNVKNAYVDRNIDCLFLGRGFLSLHIENLFLSKNFRGIYTRRASMELDRIDVSNINKLELDIEGFKHTPGFYDVPFKFNIKEITCSTEKTTPFKFIINLTELSLAAEPFFKMTTPIKISENIKEINFVLFLYTNKIRNSVERAKLLNQLKEYLPEYKFLNEKVSGNRHELTLVRKN